MIFFMIFDNFLVTNIWPAKQKHALLLDFAATTIIMGNLQKELFTIQETAGSENVLH